MFTKEKLERWINVLNSCGSDLVMERESTTNVIKKMLVGERLRDLKELRDTLEQIYTTITKED